MIRLSALFFVLFAGMSTLRSDAPEFVASEATSSFGERIRFSTQVRSGQSLTDAHLTIRMEDGSAVELSVQTTEEDGYRLAAEWDVSSRPLFPFSRLSFLWEVEDALGRKAASSPQVVEYADDRFSWRMLDRGTVAVHWIDGSDEEAQNAANLILLTLGSVSADLAAPIPDLVRVYIYPRLDDLRSALSESLHGWEGGVSAPSSAVILVAAAPGAEGRRTLAILLPHETVHVLLGSKYPPDADDLPVWFGEGLAAFYEMEPRPDLDRILSDAVREEDLIPIPALCAVFPTDESPALLAYAESRSFVAFLRGEFGRETLRQAADSYSAGAVCSDGFLAATGKTLEELEILWRTELTGGMADGFPVGILMAVGAGLLVLVLLAGSAIRRRRGVFHPGVRR
jgi:hypothetical protein